MKEELQRAKDRMSIDFEANRIKKDEDGFVYDVRRDFGEPEEASGWDSD